MGAIVRNGEIYGSNMAINDAQTSANTTWSSEKIDNTKADNSRVAALETTAHGFILNSEYGIDVRYYSVGNIVLIESMTNKLTKAIPQNTWITLISNIPSTNANFYPQASTISYNGKVLSFYIIGTEIRIICRSSGGVAINDGFSIEMVYIKE